jgi:hypothetical protein
MGATTAPATSAARLVVEHVMLAKRAVVAPAASRWTEAYAVQMEVTASLGESAQIIRTKPFAVWTRPVPSLSSPMGVPTPSQMALRPP